MNYFNVCLIRVFLVSDALQTVILVVEVPASVEPLFYLLDPHFKGCQLESWGRRELGVNKVLVWVVYVDC